MAASLNQQYFDDVYGANADPWNFKTSAYEREKYADTIASLPADRYHSGFEIGCSIGVLTEMLAKKADQLLSVDISEAPLKEARQRNAANNHVSVQQMTIPAEFPVSDFDLIVMSEVGYYFSKDDLQILLQKIGAHLVPSGHLLLVHWLPFVHDYPLTGDEVHEIFLNACGSNNTFSNIFSARREKYRIDLLQKN